MLIVVRRFIGEKFRDVLDVLSVGEPNFLLAIVAIFLKSSV